MKLSPSYSRLQSAFELRVSEVNGPCLGAENGKRAMSSLDEGPQTLLDA